VNYKQCSWNADNPQGWRNMIASHNKFAGQSAWNELMLFNFGPSVDPGFNSLMNNWTVAVFYDAAKAGSLADAQSFQRKWTSSGRPVPVLKLDFTEPSSRRFQYNVADQVAYP
jgi:hypothetical protein